MNNLNIQHVLDGLKELGFTEYEARIYVSLLRSHPANGNAIATLAGVPAPKVYETLRRMQERELVFTVSGGEKGNQIRYSPLPHQELLSRFKKAFSHNVSFLEASLVEVSSMSDTSWTELFVIHGYSASLEALRSAITYSKSDIVMSCWRKELETLKEPLTEAHNRGTQIVTLIFDGGEIDVPWRNFVHYRGEVAHLRHKGELSLVVDQEKAIVLQSANDHPHAVVSSHPVMIMTTRNYIRHDIYVNRVLQDFEEVMTERYGPELENLINDF